MKLHWDFSLRETEMWNSGETATERAVCSSSLHGGCCGNHVIRWDCQGGCYRDGGDVLGEQ